MSTGCKNKLLTLNIVCKTDVFVKTYDLRLKHYVLIIIHLGNNHNLHSYYYYVHSFIHHI